jgi:hypothetical protein
LQEFYPRSIKQKKSNKHIILGNGIKTTGKNILHDLQTQADIEEF